MEKKSFAQAQADIEARNHNSNMENLANAKRYIGEERERLKKELEDLAELESDVEDCANNDPLNGERVWELYGKAAGMRFNNKKSK